MSAGTPELRVDQVVLQAGAKRILDRVSLEVGRGEVVALLGPSGCGKTSLLRVIAGLAEIEGGSLHLRGQDITHAPPQQRGIGMLFQQYALFPNLSVTDNIQFGLRARGVGGAAAAARAEDLLALIELAALRDARPRQLSGGQQQRVALARALAPQPAVLLLDEPFSALDESFRVPLRRSFRRIQRALGQTCIVVTHDREEAFEMADRVAVMFDGRVQQIDAPRALWKAPANHRVAEFLGSFNVLRADRPFAGLAPKAGYHLLPTESLRLLPIDAVPLPDELVFEATVTEAVEQIRTRSVGLVLASGEALVAAAAGAALPEEGQRVRCAVARGAIGWVAE